MQFVKNIYFNQSEKKIQSKRSNQTDLSLIPFEVFISNFVFTPKNIEEDHSL